MTNEENKNTLADEEATVLSEESLTDEASIGYYYSENSVSRLLDDALLNGGNVLIEGLTGSGKTASARDWLERHSNEVNGLYIDCVGIEIPIGLITLRKDLILCGQIFDDKTIDNMLKKDFVAVFDNCDAADESVKQHILLLCDGYVVDGRMPDRLRKVSTRRFVACIITKN